MGLLHCSKQQKRKGCGYLPQPLMSCWCRGRESNPHGGCHYHLKIACLPIPPPRHKWSDTENRWPWQELFFVLEIFFVLSVQEPGGLRWAQLTGTPRNGKLYHCFAWRKIMDDAVRSFLQKTGPVLCVDIGSGTQDVLLARPGLEVHNWPHHL